MGKETLFYIVFSIIAIITPANCDKFNVVKLLKGECHNDDPQLVHNLTCYTKAINRTTSMFTVEGYLLESVGDIVVNFQMYKKTDVKYRLFLINSTEKYCSFAANRKATRYVRILTDLFLKYSNLDHPCPYIGHFYVKDFVVDPQLLPSIFPFGEYRFDLNILTGSR